MTNQNSNLEPNLQDVLERMWRTAKKIAVFQFLTLLATVFVILFWPRTYLSEAKVFLNRGRESIGLDPTATMGKTIALHQAGREAEIKSAIDVLSSRGVIEPAVDQLSPDLVLNGLTDENEKGDSVIQAAIRRVIGTGGNVLRSIDPASDRERAVVRIEKNLIVQAERKSEIVSVQYEADSPLQAKKVVEELVKEYKQKHSLMHRTTGSTEFFDEQRGRLGNDLEIAALALEQAKNEIGTASIVDQTAIAESRLGSIRTSLMDVEKQLTAAKAKGKSLAGQLNERPERTGTEKVHKPNSGDDLQGQLFYALQLRLLDAEAKYTPRHPQVRLLKQQVAEAELELDKQQKSRVEETNNINPVHERLTMAYTENSAELASLMASRQQVISQERDVLDHMKELNRYSVKIRQLERDLAVAEKKYLIYAENLEEARVNKRMQGGISSINIVQPATMQEKPVAPSKPIVVLCGLMLAMAGTLVLAFLSIQFDDRITSSSSARKRLDVPVLGVLPQSKAHSRVLA